MLCIWKSVIKIKKACKIKTLQAFYFYVTSEGFEPPTLRAEI